MNMRKIYVPARCFEGEVFHVPEDMMDAYVPIFVRADRVSEFREKREAITDDEFHTMMFDDELEYYVGLTD